MIRRRPAAQPGRIPTVGTETELLPVVTGMSAEAAVGGLLTAARRRFRTVAAARGGLFTGSARLYRDCGSLLEVCSLPASTLDGVWRQLAVALATTRLLAGDLRTGEQALRALVCPPTDAAFRAGDPARTQGHHLNYAAPPLGDRDAAFFEACLHATSAITGPGGFVRGQSGGRFVVDPRRQHLFAVGSAPRPLFRTKPGRIEVMAFGFTQNPIDVWLRVGLPWLALCTIALRPDLVPTVRCSMTQPNGVVHVGWRDRPSAPGPLVDLLERILIEVFEPMLDHEEVVLAGLEEVVTWARRGVSALRRLAFHDIAREFPAAFALKAFVFQKILAAKGRELPRAWSRGPTTAWNDDLARLARGAVLADCVLAPTALQRMALDVEARTWELAVLEVPTTVAAPLPPPCAGATDWCWQLHERLLAERSAKPWTWDLP
ncbi:MAG: hypothetical protein IPK26_20450 [Planctomycetes bacterium]|nr:hypothetical protein [Planctomycetota bacterium]